MHKKTLQEVKDTLALLDNLRKASKRAQEIKAERSEVPLEVGGKTFTARPCPKCGDSK